MSQNIRKRNNFHSKIRREHIQGIFSTIRTQNQFNFLINDQSECQYLIKKSLISDGLVDELRNQSLLQRLQKKYSNHPNKSNKRYILSLCSNILPDNISLIQKQKIMSLCVPICLQVYKELQRNQPELIDIKVLAYFYLMSLNCFDQFDDDLQLKIQQNLFIFVSFVLKMPQILNNNESIYQDIETILLLYFPNQKNSQLFYRIQRQAQFIKNLIQTMQQTKRKYLQLWPRISLFPTVNLHKNTLFIDFLVNQLQKDPSNRGIYICICNMLSQDECVLLENEINFKLIMKCIQLGNITEQKFETIQNFIQQKTVRDSELIQNVVQYLIQLLKYNQQIGNLIKSLELLLQILSIDVGGRGWKCFCNLGGRSLLQQMQYQTKSQQLSNMISSFWSLCIDVQF